MQVCAGRSTRDTTALRAVYQLLYIMHVSVGSGLKGSAREKSQILLSIESILKFPAQFLEFSSDRSRHICYRGPRHSRLARPLDLKRLSFTMAHCRHSFSMCG